MQGPKDKSHTFFKAEKNSVLLWVDFGLSDPTDNQKSVISDQTDHITNVLLNVYVCKYVAVFDI